MSQPIHAVVAHLEARVVVGLFEATWQQDEACKEHVYSGTSIYSVSRQVSYAGTVVLFVSPLASGG